MKKVIVITSHPKGYWDGGDSVITHGLYWLLPELHKCNTSFSANIPFEETENYVKECDYIIHAGTPSWVTQNNRRFWTAAMKFKKHIAMLGVGLALPYSFDFWYGSEDFIHLRDAKLIDVIICRDKFCYYWVKKLGFYHDKVDILPCPGFYCCERTAVTSTKKEVILSLANIDETARETRNTFKDYFEKSRYLADELVKRNANVHLLYQRRFDNYPSAKIEFNKWFHGFHIHSFNTPQPFVDFILNKDVYIGVRNHGALPCAGAGKPSMLLGTDYRQFLADEIPYISRIDISHADWLPRNVLDWYDALHVECLSRSLENFRNLTTSRWKQVLDLVRNRIT